MLDFRKTNFILTVLVVVLLVGLGSWIFLFRDYFWQAMTPLAQVNNGQETEYTTLPEATTTYTNETFGFSLAYPESYNIVSIEESTAIDPISRDEIDKLILVIGNENSDLNPVMTLYINPTEFASQADRIYTIIEQADGHLMIVGETQYNLEGLETERYVTSAVLSDNNVYSWEMITLHGGSQTATEFKNIIESFKLEPAPEEDKDSEN